MVLETLEEQTFIDDPLLCKVDLPLRAVFYPLGFAFEITTNSQAVLDAAGQSWAHTKQRDSGPVLRLRIGVTRGTSQNCPPAPVVRCQQNLLSMVADAHNQAICDLNAGFAFAWLTEDAVRHPSYTRYHFLEAVALILISTSYATPIHAACVSRYGSGMLVVRRFRRRQINPGLRLRSQRMAFYLRRFQLPQAQFPRAPHRRKFASVTFPAVRQGSLSRVAGQKRYSPRRGQTFHRGADRRAARNRHSGRGIGSSHHSAESVALGARRTAAASPGSRAAGTFSNIFHFLTKFGRHKPKRSRPSVQPTSMNFATRIFSRRSTASTCLARTPVKPT